MGKQDAPLGLLSNFPSASSQLKGILESLTECNEASDPDRQESFEVLGCGISLSCRMAVALVQGDQEHAGKDLGGCLISLLHYLLRWIDNAACSAVSAH